MPRGQAGAPAAVGGGTATGAGGFGAGGMSSGGAFSSGGGDSSGTGGTLGAGGLVGTGGSGDAGYCGTKVPQSLPLQVSRLFSASGFMGDHQDISLTETCAGRAHASATGTCYSITYTPTGPEGWAGVAWQYPQGNWGDSPGLCVAAGAARVGFWARGDAGGEVVNFGAAGMALGEKPLSTAWTYFEVPLSSGYNTSGSSGGVAIGFSFAAPKGNRATKRFFVDDVRWLP